MDEKLSRETVGETARLARLLLSPEEIDRFTTQLGEILAYMDILDTVDTRGVEPMAHVLPLTNAVRDDCVAPSIGAELAVREAPDRHDRFFQVPKVLGDGSGA